MAQVLIDPISRIEGHLSVELDVQKGIVASSKIKGDMFRGFELILKGRNPVDANMISQRICGVCPISHAIASSKCLESAFGIKPTRNGMILRNIILATNFLQSHIIHFYHLALMDYIDIKAVVKYSGRNEKLKSIKEWALKEVASTGKGQSPILAPFLPRYEGDFYIKNDDLNIRFISGYFTALDIRMKCQKLASIFAGKIPHAASIVPGGVTQKITPENVAEYIKLFAEVQKFVNEVYYQDTIALSKSFPEYTKIGGFDKFLCFGVFGDEFLGDYLFDRGILNNGVYEPVDFKKITEDVKFAKYSSKSGLAPNVGDTIPEPEKKDAYTWSKAPRYNSMPYEVGPLARIYLSYQRGNTAIKNAVIPLIKEFKSDITVLNSLMGRHMCRALEARIIVDQIPRWLNQLQSDSYSRTKYEIPKNAEGAGFVEAPRGALGHWITIRDYKIDNYQCVVPTTWNISPRDDKGVPGVIEQVLTGLPVSDIKNPIEPARLIRSFDPCIACAVHAVEKA